MTTDAFLRETRAGRCASEGLWTPEEAKHNFKLSRDPCNPVFIKFIP